MHEDVKWLFGVILLFGVLWFASGGPSNKTSSSNPFLGSASENSSYAHIGANSSDASGQTVTKKLTAQEEISQGLTDAGIKADQIKKELAALEEASHASPLTKKLFIANMSRGSGSSAGEYIAIEASSSNTEKILITGLRLQSPASGRGVDIPKGVLLPFQNQINKEQPIYLNPGDVAYIITGRSPLGASFRLNKCTGFFNQYQNFNPSLPKRCPRPNENDLPVGATQYNDACRDYINSLPSCQVILNPPQSISPECQRYVINEISYTKCVDRFKNDSDFYDSTWRVYLARDDALWKNNRELIHLLDQNGKIIDAVTY